MIVARIAAGLSLLIAAPSALAQSTAEPAPARVFGAGATLGGGIDANSNGSVFGTVIGPALELRVPVHRRVELSVWAPAFNMLIVNLRSDRKWLWLDAFVTCFALRDSSGLFVAPGLGVVWGTSDAGSGAALQIPARIGWQVSTPGRAFGFDVALRPWFDVVFPSTNIDVGTRYGALVELGFFGYATR
ncbi:MAG: hypothetical protein U0269_18445 [Polyangiales bacterium]